MLPHREESGAFRRSTIQKAPRRTIRRSNVVAVWNSNVEADLPVDGRRSAQPGSRDHDAVTHRKIIRFDKSLVVLREFTTERCDPRAGLRRLPFKFISNFSSFDAPHRYRFKHVAQGARTKDGLAFTIKNGVIWIRQSQDIAYSADFSVRFVGYRKPQAKIQDHHEAGGNYRQWKSQKETRHQSLLYEFLRKL